MSDEIRRALVSVDMEGIAGVVDVVDVRPGEAEYERNRHLMTAEASAAVRGVLAHSPAAEVLVADAHGGFRNLLPEQLDPRAWLLRGSPRPDGMMAGLDGVDVVVFVGYHGKAGTAGSVLSHTINGAVIADVRLDGRSVGELGLNAALATSRGAVPVLAVGDDTVALEAADVVPGIHTVVVKHALSWFAARTMHPSEACARIEAAVGPAIDARATMSPIEVVGPVHLEVDVSSVGRLQHVHLVPGLVRVAPMTVAYDAPDLAAAYRVVQLVAVLGGA